MVRRASAADVAVMHAIRMRVLENRLSDPESVQAHHYCERLAAGAGWVCEHEGIIVGFGVADARDGSIWALFVDPAHEGRGIGRRLHDAMVAWLFSAGCERIWLTTGAQTRAEHFYRAAGWEAVGVTDSGEVRFEKRAADSDR